MNKRKARYLEVADLIIETDGKSPQSISREIIEGIDKLAKNS